MLEGDDANQRPLDYVGAVLRGKWTLDQKLGRGRISTFYAATYRTGQRVALELLDPMWSRDAALSASFLRECYVANRVQHPGVVRVLDDGVTDDGLVFIVTDLLEGETLDARITRLGRLPRSDAFDLGDRLLDIVSAAHEVGVVHGDVRVQNVFLTTKGELRVLGYGVARLFNTRFPEWSAGPWMPPETRENAAAEIDIRTDVWLVGGCLYKMMTGHFDPQPNGMVRPVRELALDTSMETADVIDRALQRAAGERWQAARQMQQAWRVAWAETDDVTGTREQTQIDAGTSTEDPDHADDESTGPSSLTAISLGASRESLGTMPTRAAPPPNDPTSSTQPAAPAFVGNPTSSARPSRPSQSHSQPQSHGQAPPWSQPTSSAPLSPGPASPTPTLGIPISAQPLASSQGAPLSPHAPLPPQSQGISHGSAAMIPVAFSPNPPSVSHSRQGSGSFPPASLGGYTPPGVGHVSPKVVVLLVAAGLVLLCTGALLAVVVMHFMHPGGAP